MIKNQIKEPDSSNRVNMHVGDSYSYAPYVLLPQNRFPWVYQWIRFESQLNNTCLIE